MEKNQQVRNPHGNIANIVLHLLEYLKPATNLACDAMVVSHQDYYVEFIKNGPV
ncbi:MAG: hypothetical protein IPN82_12800 [Chitinophagaceae bacterium]|nr:hypothetical protein [Chitinophagaceae bacterium]